MTRRPCAHFDCDDSTDQGRYCYPCWASRKDHPGKPCRACALKRKTRPRVQRSVEAMYDEAYGDDGRFYRSPTPARWE